MKMYKRRVLVILLDVQVEDCEDSVIDDKDCV